MPREGFSRKRGSASPEENDSGIAEGVNIRQPSRILQQVEDNAFHHPFPRTKHCLPRYNTGYECILEFFRNLTGTRRGTKGFDVRSNFAAWNHCLSCHPGHSPAWTQTLSLAENS